MPTPQTSEAPGVPAPEASEIKDQVKGSDMNNVTIFGGDRNSVTMSSREIAELCEKRHSDVKRDIEKMCKDIQLGDARKFAHIYLDTRNREQTEYRLLKDLTVTLITGYRTDLRYRVVKKLEEMEMASRPKSTAEVILWSAQQLVAQDQRISAVEEKLSEYDAGTGYMSVLAYARMHDIKIPSSDARRIGTRAGAICRERGERIGSVPDERYGRVNSYPVAIIRDALDAVAQVCEEQ